MLQGRDRECQELDRLLQRIRIGESAALVLRGEAGIGKTALLDHVAEQASGCRVARAIGVQSEMELTFAGLHHLCAPLLDGLEALPAPQREALQVAFGLREGDPPDRFLVALAVLSLLAEVAEARPLVCVIDDAQWLDRSSALVLAFVARRLLAERVAVVFAVREPAEEDALTGLPELRVEGLADADARSLLASTVLGRLDERVRDRIVAETRGNPLALLELPRGLTPAELAGGFGLPDASPLAGRIEHTFLQRAQALPPDAQRLLLVAAAEPAGDVGLLWRAAERVGVGREAGRPAEEADLIELGFQVRFRHPLVRSAVYRGADPARATRRAPRSGGGDRSRRGPGPARVARGPRDQRARRGGGRRHAALGRPGAAPRGPGGGRRVPAACDRADARPRPAHRAGADRGAGEARRRRPRGGLRARHRGAARPDRRAPARAARAAARARSRSRRTRGGDAPALPAGRGSAPGAARSGGGARDLPRRDRGRDVHGPAQRPARAFARWRRPPARRRRGRARTTGSWRPW